MPGIPWAIGAGIGQGLTEAQQFNNNATQNQIALAQLRQLMAQQQAAQAFYHSQLGGGGLGLPTDEAPAPQAPPPIPTPNLQSGPQPGMQMGPQPGMQPGGQPGGQNFMPPSPLQTAGLPMGGPQPTLASIGIPGGGVVPTGAMGGPPPLPPPGALPPMGAGAGIPQSAMAGLSPQFASLVPQIAGPESGGRNIPSMNYPKETAGGILQINNPTWKDYAWKAGVPIGAPGAGGSLAMGAPIADQLKVGNAIFNARGTEPWHAPGVPKVPAPGKEALAKAAAAGRGPPPPGAEDAALAIDNTAPNIDPAKMGRMAMHELAQQIEQANPDAPDLVKAMAFQMGIQYLAPEWRQAWEELKQRTHENFLLKKQYEHEDFLEKQRLAAQEGKGWQIYESGGKVYRVNPNTGEKEPMDLEPDAHKLGTGAGAGEWSKDAMEALVDRALTTGDASVLSQLPRSGPARKQFEEALATRLKSMPGGIAGGVSTMVMNQLRITEAKAAAQQAGRVTMNTALYSAEAEGAAKLVVDASKGVPRTSIPAINVIEEAGLTQTGDPGIVKLGIAINSLLNAYGKMSNPTGIGIHDADKTRLEGQLTKALAEGQIEAGVQQIILEGKNLSSAAQQAQIEVMAGLTPQTPGAPPRQPAPQPSPGGQAAPEGKDQPTSAGPNPSTGEYPVDLSGLSQQEFDKEWNSFAPGQAYIGLDGKPYKKKQTPSGKK